MPAPALPSLSCTAARPADDDFQLVMFRSRPAEAMPRTRGSRGSERHRRPPRASLAPHQPRPTRDAARALERGGLAAVKAEFKTGDPVSRIQSREACGRRGLPPAPLSRSRGGGTPVRAPARSPEEAPPMRHVCPPPRRCVPSRGSTRCSTTTRKATDDPTRRGTGARRVLRLDSPAACG